MKNRKLLLIVSLVLALTMSLGGTLAYLTDTEEAVNVMTLGNVDIEQNEIGADGKPFEQSQPLYPAYDNGTEKVGTIVKKVSVENTGSSDAYVRTWMAFEAGNITDLKTFKDLINIDFAVENINWLEGVYEIDGQKYFIANVLYTEAVKPGDIVNSLESFYMASSAGNDDVAQFGNTYEVLVLSQAVQTNNMPGAAEAMEAAFPGMVHPWVGKDIAELPTKVVNNAAELKAALEEGGMTVVLGADIDMDADNTITIAAGKSARLDLAGHTLSGVADGTGNREMFLVKGNLTVNDGNLEMSATVNQGWGAMTTIFDVTAGGVLNLNGVTAKNLGGSDMAFVAHLNNWGEVTLNVNNCDLQSTYVAVRVFNSGYDMNNVSIYNSTIWGDNSSIWVHNYTAADFGTQEKADQQQALLNLDYNNGTNKLYGRVRLGMTNSTEAPVDFTPVYNTNAKLEAAINEGKTDLLLGSGVYVIPTAAQGKTLKITGNGSTVIATNNETGSYEGCNYALDGSTVTFENIVINTPSTTYIGYARCKATYNNCVINGTYTLYDNSEFNNCTFNVSGDVYNIWTWGANIATFNNCTFNSDGKAMLLYGQANTKLTLNDCVFNDNGGLTDLKAAVEIGNDYGTSYELIVNNTTVNGYEINDKGINTGSTLWGNKNSMGTDKLNVVVDGVDVY